MYRDVDPRLDERDRADLFERGRGGSDDRRPLAAEDPRDVFSRDLDLPRGPTRERVVVRSHEYRLRGSEVRTLATTGAFRVVRAEELRRPDDRRTALDNDLDRLRDAGLVRTIPYVVGRERTRLVTLTDRGREVLEAARRPRVRERPQAFYADIAKSRELSHDVRVYSAYRQASERLISDGNRLTRAVLDYELKREYQEFLQAPNRGRRDSSGRSPRDPLEIAQWAQEHELPVVDGRVKFPDVRIEYERPDGGRDREDIEVMTPHYRGAHAASKVQAGFTRYGSAGARVGGRGSPSGGRTRDARLAEEMLR